ncbi:MAG: YggS family pyridoxal phosphate-dependent enzyme [Flavobacteriales bacterium]|nr:YggS family pyridoxal phosphate-dependent enzyme [Flavobacteriales bacterium]
MIIPSNLLNISKDIGPDVTLVAVSKTKPVEDIKTAYDFGQRNFGENKVQELIKKSEELPNDINWHMIGHLQRNKVKYIVPFIHLIHSVDSLRLLKEINKQAKKQLKKVNVLIQVDISNDDSKFGFSLFEINDLFEKINYDDYQNILFKGLMGMASFTSNKEIIRKQFNSLNNVFQKFKKRHSFEYLSMGMSGDYIIALECGSNMIRLGSNIFGKR